MMHLGQGKPQRSCHIKYLGSSATIGGTSNPPGDVWNLQVSMSEAALLRSTTISRKVLVLLHKQVKKRFDVMYVYMDGISFRVA